MSDASQGLPHPVLHASEVRVGFCVANCLKNITNKLKLDQTLRINIMRPFLSVGNDIGIYRIITAAIQQYLTALHYISTACLGQ